MSRRSTLGKERAGSPEIPPALELTRDHSNFSELTYSDVSHMSDSAPPQKGFDSSKSRRGNIHDVL